MNEVATLGGSDDLLKGWRRPPEGQAFHCYGVDAIALCGRYRLVKPYPDNFAPNGTDAVYYPVCKACEALAPMKLPTVPPPLDAPAA